MTTLKQALITLEQQADTDFRRQALRKMLLPLIRGTYVLDAGCGMGFMTRSLSVKGYQVVASDIEYEYVAAAVSATYLTERLAQGVVSGDGRLPFATGSYDAILSLDVIEHIADDAHVLREFARVLRPNGQLLLTVPALPSLFGKRDLAMGHYRRYTKVMLQERLNAAGFVIERLSYWNLLGVLPYFLAERVLRRPVSDAIRQGRPTLSRRVIAALIKQWLLSEWAVAPLLPLGLSLVVMARPQQIA